MGDMDYAKGVDAGRYQGAVNVANAAALISQKRSRTINIRVAADAAANTNLAEQDYHQYPNWPGGGKITDARVSVITNVTAGNATNHAILTLAVRDDAQGAAVTAGIINTATSNLTAFVGKQFTFTKNQLTLAALSHLTFKHDKVGSGLALPAYSLTVVVEDT